MAGLDVGTFGARLLMWDWIIEDPVIIARPVDSLERGATYLERISTCIFLMLLLMPFVAAVSALVAAPDFRFDTLSMALVSVLAGMSIAWFCIGMGQPRLLATFDTIPCSLATSISAPLVLVTHQPWYFAVVFAITTVLAFVLFSSRLAP